MAQARLEILFGAAILVFLIQTEAVRHGKNLIWTQTPSLSVGLSRIVGIEGDPLEWVPSGNVQVRHISAPNNAWKFKGLAFNYAQQTLYWSEAANKKVQGLVLNGSTSTITVANGLSGEVEGLALDWLSNNIYWTDSLYNWVMMCSLGPNGYFPKIVVRANLTNPHGIAVHPQKGSLFWTDWGVKSKIEVSDLFGRNRRVLVDQDLGHPRGLTIDYNTSVIYWVDSLKDTIEAVELNGNNRRVVKYQEGTIFFSLAVYQKYLFVTEQMHGHLRVYEKLSGNNEINYNLGYTPNGIVMYDEDVQTGNSTECDEAGCQQICIRDPLIGPTCDCGFGYILQKDQKSCLASKKFIQPSHVYAIRDSICQYPVNMPDMSLVNVTLDSQCFMEGAKGYLALTFDARANTLFFSENATKSIVSLNMEIGMSPEYVVRGVGEVQGMALDWVTGNLFWTDNTNKHIAMATKEGFHQTILVEGLEQPVGIAVHPGMGLMFWVDRGIYPSIGVAGMDGSGVRDLVNSSQLDTPNHLFLDFSTDRLYFTDSGMYMIRFIDLNTGEINLVYDNQEQRTKFYGVSLYQDYILWTDNDDMNGIHAARLDKVEKVRGILHPYVGLAHDVVTVDILNQPDLQSACGKNNGFCEQLCIPTSNVTYMCACGVGFDLDENLRTCSSRITTDNFILVMDSYQQQVYQIEAESHAVHAIPLGGNFGGVALDFDPISNTIYWTDNKENVIMSSGIDGFNVAIFKSLPSGSVVDGLAVDYMNRLLFHTNTNTDTIVVTSLRDANMYKTIINDSLDEPRDILVFPEIGRIYWTDWGLEPKIESAAMDGSDRKLILRMPNGSWPNGIAIDKEGMELFWVDAKNDVIGAINLTSGVKRELLREKMAHYFGISLMGQNLYITDWMRKHVIRTPVSGGSVEKVGPSRFSRLNGIHAYNTSEVRTKLGKCLNSLCSHLCLPTSGDDYVCACPDPNSTLALGSPCVVKIQYALQKNKREDSTAIVIGMSVVGIVVACLIAFGILYSYKRCRSVEVPHGRLVEDPRGDVDTFYRLTFPENTRDETNFDSGIENPSFNCSTEDLQSGSLAVKFRNSPPL